MRRRKSGAIQSNKYRIWFYSLGGADWRVERASR
jgi:hypothetical protein